MYGQSRAIPTISCMACHNVYIVLFQVVVHCNMILIFVLAVYIPCLLLLLKVSNLHTNACFNLLYTVCEVNDIFHHYVISTQTFKFESSSQSIRYLNYILNLRWFILVLLESLVNIFVIYFLSLSPPPNKKQAPFFSDLSPKETIFRVINLPQTSKLYNLSLFFRLWITGLMVGVAACLC